MKILDLIFGTKNVNYTVPVIFSVDMIIEGDPVNAPKGALGRFQEHILYSFSLEGKNMGWWQRGSFINHIDNIIEEQAVTFFPESWQSTYSITEEETDDGILHVIFFFPQPELHETPYTRTQANIVAEWLRKALHDAQKTGQIAAICEEKVQQDVAATGFV